MQIYISKAGQQYGPYTVEQLRVYVQQGNFTTADLACCDGQNWVKVAEVPGFAAGGDSMTTPQQDQVVHEQLPKSANSSYNKKFHILWGSTMFIALLLLVFGNDFEVPDIIPCDGCGKDLDWRVNDFDCLNCDHNGYDSYRAYMDSQWLFGWPIWLKFVKNILGILLVFLCILGPIIYTRDKKEWKAVEEILKNNQAQLDLFNLNLKANNGLTERTTSFLLDNDETCFHREPSNLYETKSVRHHQSSRVGVRVVKGLWIGKSQGTSFSADEWTLISSGNLAITNKRLIFDGTSQNRTVKINKIIGVNPSIGQVEVVVDGRPKSMVFDVSNGMILQNIIRICKSAPDPSNFGDNVKITVDYGSGEVPL
jgi:hypothetical protein